MIRLLVYGFLIYVAYRILKPKLAGTGKADGGNDREAELIKDPQCGTYFLKRHGVRARIKGKDVYFCSRQCRDSYLAAQGRRR